MKITLILVNVHHAIKFNYYIRKISMCFLFVVITLTMC